MATTFNCGIGMVMIVSSHHVAQIESILHALSMEKTSSIDPSSSDSSANAINALPKLFHIGKVESYDGNGRVLIDHAAVEWF